MKIQTLPWDEAVRVLALPGLENSLFSSASWMRVIRRTYGTPLFVKYIEREGRLDSWIVYSVVRNFLEWKVCSCSYCDYCDGRVQGLEDWQAFLEALIKEYPRYRIAIRSLRDENVRKVPGLQELSRERFHILDVRDAPETLWKRLHDGFRSAVKQARKKGVTVRRCPQSELAAFYRLHLKVRKNKYRLFPQPYRFLDVIWQEYMDHDKGLLLGAYDPQGRFIGGNIYLVCGNTLYYKFNTSALDALPYRPNNILFWEGVCQARAMGLDFIDLSSSGCDQHGLILFKNQTGADCRDIVHLGWHPPGHQFSRKRILKSVTRFFTHPWMPEAGVRLGSRITYRYLA